MHINVLLCFEIAGRGVTFLGTFCSFLCAQEVKIFYKWIFHTVCAALEDKLQSSDKDNMLFAVLTSWLLF